MNLSFWGRYIQNKRLIVEILFLIIFLYFSLPYFGIPDSYDFYIYIFLKLAFLFHLILYFRFIKKELEEILNEK